MQAHQQILVVLVYVLPRSYRFRLNDFF